MISISVCMIVKNEEMVLERVLQCALKFADEIVVVDTGSTDKTKEIAKKFTDHVYDFTWVDDFSKARNLSFEKGTKDYLMWLDADDVITDENIEKILRLKNEIAPETDVVMMKYSMGFDENNKPQFSFYRERLVKKSKGFKWKGFIHEAITPAGNIVYEDIEIEHRKINEGKPDRNLNIYKKHIKNGYILDARDVFYFARELYYNKKYKAAILQFKKFLKYKNGFLPNILDAHLICGKCYKMLGQGENALDILLKSLKKAQPSGELCCEIGEVFVEKKDYKSAIFWYKNAISATKNIESGAFYQQSYYDFIPYLQLCYCYFSIGDMELSKFFNTLAENIYPNNPSVIYNKKFFEKQENKKPQAK